MKKENIAIIQMLVCAALWSIAGIFIKLIPWNAFAISSLRGLIAGITILVFIRIKGYKLVFNRKTVIVTGASQGIGRSVAIHFAKAGANVFVACSAVFKAESPNEMIKTLKENAKL